MAVFTAESSLNPTADNHFCCYGVAQINLYAHWGQIPGATKEEKIAWLWNPDNNLTFAKHLYDEQGWQPWQAFTDKAYLKYMDD